MRLNGRISKLSNSQSDLLNQFDADIASGRSLNSAARDERWMRVAIALGRRNLGVTWPNPSVGCIVVQAKHGNDIVVGRGTTAIGGRPHAETLALDQAGKSADGATVYVTLEPCSHVGKTEPCSQALIRANVRRVVVGTNDPNPKVSGLGIRMLKEGGIATEGGVLENDCRRSHVGHIFRMTRKRPFISLKMAVSSDGYIGRMGDGQVAISSDQSMRFAHSLRSQSDGIIVGIGTVLADNPALTCRVPGLVDRSPTRIVVDSKARLPLDCKLVENLAKVPVYCLTTESAAEARCMKLTDAGVNVIRVPQDESGRVDLKSGMEKLAEIGLTRVMVEGGSCLAASLLEQDLIDEATFVFGQTVVGENGVRPVGDVPLEWFETSGKFTIEQTRYLGDDRVVKYGHRDLGACLPE